jgi:hypothetical protein
MNEMLFRDAVSHIKIKISRICLNTAATPSIDGCSTYVTAGNRDSRDEYDPVEFSIYGLLSSGLIDREILDGRKYPGSSSGAKNVPRIRGVRRVAVVLVHVGGEAREQLPQVVGADTTPYGWYPRGLALDNGYVYLSDGTALRIVDARVPSLLVPVARYDIGGYNNIDGLALAGGWAFLACEDPNLVVLDVSNPETIQELGRWNGGMPLGGQR